MPTDSTNNPIRMTEFDPAHLLVSSDQTHAIREATFRFDGREFFISVANLLPVLHLAALARRGDVLAIELCAAGRLHISDASGEPYWPRDDKEERT